MRDAFKDTINELGARLEKTESALSVATRANDLLARDLGQLRRRVTNNEWSTIQNGQYLCNAQIVLKKRNYRETSA